jgi:hypothetical protein
VRAAVRRFYRSLALGRPGTACALLSRRMVTQLGRASSSTRPGLIECPEALKRLRSAYPARYRRGLARLRVTTVRFFAKRAVATYVGPGLAATTVPLVNEHQGWRLAAVGGAPRASRD